MSIVGIGLNLLLAVLLGAALVMGWRLNKRLQALRDSHDGFAIAVRELNTAAARAEQGLADLRAATDEATDELADRIEKGRALATKLERLLDQGAQIAPQKTREAPDLPDDRAQERRLGALLAAAREARARPERLLRSVPAQASRARPIHEDDLFDDGPLPLTAVAGGAR
jgi:septal ring factor EnvC (AmiA/AmiB activator)